MQNLRQDRVVVSECDRVRELHEVITEVDGLMCGPTDSQPAQALGELLWRRRLHELVGKSVPVVELSCVRAFRY